MFARSTAAPAGAIHHNTTPATIGGQLFQAGVAFAFAGAALVSGLGLVFGADALAAAGGGILWFTFAGLAGWLAELCFAPGFERLALERQQLARASQVGGGSGPRQPIREGSRDASRSGGAERQEA